MIDFVSALIRALTQHLHLRWASHAGMMANDARVVFSGSGKDTSFTVPPYAVTVPELQRHWDQESTATN